MHAAAWRSRHAVQQLRRRPMCRLVAGARLSLRRSFHPSRAIYQTPEAPTGTAASKNENKDDLPEKLSAQIGSESLVADGEEKAAKLNDGAHRSGRRQNYGSGIRRASRNKAPTGLPPLIFPDWFWERNVTCYGEPEDVAQRVNVIQKPGFARDEQPVGSSALLSINGEGVLALSSHAIPKLEMEIYITEKLRKDVAAVLKRLQKTTGEYESTAEGKEENADRPLEMASNQESIEKSVSLLRQGAPLKKIVAIAQANDVSRLKNPSYWYSLPAEIYNEIYMSFCGQLKVPPPKMNVKDINRQDVLLLCPKDGGLNFLSAVVQKVAIDLEADVVRLDAEDIAQIVGPYLGEDVAWTKDPTALLGYRTPRRSDGPEPLNKGDSIEEEKEEKEEEDIDETGESEENHSHMFPPDFIGRGKGLPLLAAFSFMQTPPKLVPGHGLPKGLNLFNILGQAANSGPFSAQSASPGEGWNDYKISRAMEAVVGAADAKRAKNVFKLVEDQQSMGRSVLPTSKGLILQITGYKELNEHPLGYNLLNSLREAVKKHWQEGTNIVIAGTAAENSEPTLVQAQDSLTDRHTLGVISDSPRTIFVPPECHHARIENDHKLQIRNLNIRHVEHMFRRFLGSENESKWTVDLNQDLVVDRKVGRLIDQVVWGYNDVRRIATSMLATVGSDKLVDGNNLKQVLDLLRSSDSLKTRWARRVDSAQEAVVGMDAVVFDGNISTLGNTSTEKEDRLDRLKKQCTPHEKKLFGGVINAADINTTFADVRAPSDTIEALKTLTSLSLIRPDSFSYGVLATDKIPGLLLYGPPGTGKTLLAKAVAKESGATMLEVSASEINDMYVGEGEKNVKALFSLAKKLSPCVVFIDEADALFGSRGNEYQRRSHREIINQFLREWDGMKNLRAFIMVATNRPFDLDEAVLRRLPRRLLVDLPVEKDREAILKIHLRDEILDDSISFASLAKNTPFYSGSDLKNLSVAAALACVREENETAAKYTGEEPYVYPPKRILRKEHFDKAMEEISASISEDMSTLSAIRKFDEKYGDRKGRRKKKPGMGFGGSTDPEPDVEAGRVRKPELNL